MLDVAKKMLDCRAGTGFRDDDAAAQLRRQLEHLDAVSHRHADNPYSDAGLRRRLHQTGPRVRKRPTAEIPLNTDDYQFCAQGEFSSNGVSTFQNISLSATWFVNNSLLTSEGAGFFTPPGDRGMHLYYSRFRDGDKPAGADRRRTAGFGLQSCPPSPPSPDHRKPDRGREVIHKGRFDTTGRADRVLFS